VPIPTPVASPEFSRATDISGEKYLAGRGAHLYSALPREMEEARFPSAASGSNMRVRNNFARAEKHRRVRRARIAPTIMPRYTLV